MTSLAIALVLISALMHAVRDLFTKGANDKQIFLWWYQIFALLYFFPLVVYFIYTDGIPTKQALMVGLGSGLIHFFYWVFLSKSYDGGDLSHVYPIIRSSPAFVLLLSVVFLQEEVSLLGVIGIITVVVGVYLINLKGLKIHNILEPIRSIVKEKHTQFAFLTMLTVTGYSLVDKIGTSFTHPIIFAYLLSLFAFTFFTPYILTTKDKTSIKNEWNANKKSIMLNGFLVITSYSLILVAFTFSNLSYVVGLRQISIVFAVLLGGHILQEKHKFIRLSAAGIIFAGAFLISAA